MKKMLLRMLLFTAAIPVASMAQPCATSQSQIDLHVNNIEARLLNNGNLFNDQGGQGHFLFNPMPDSANPTTMFAAGLWLGGVDAGGNLKMVAADGGSGGFFAGPLLTDGTTDATACANWDRQFLVTQTSIAAFLAALQGLSGDPSAAIAQFPDIMGWPGRNNPYFADVQGFDLPIGKNLAPFFDADANGQYDPLLGDFPVVLLQGRPPFVPTEIIWSVFNDQGGGAIPPGSFSNAFKAEFQLTAWAFTSADHPVLNNTIFTSHKLISRISDPIDSCFMGMWVDFDLGCPSDDYIGSNPALDAFFVYNQDPLDGSPGTDCPSAGGPIATFGDHPPVQSVTFLSRSLDKAVYYNNGSVGNPLAATTDPDNVAEYFNYLSGTWRDGTPLTQGGSGYNTGNATPVDYAFPDDPADAAGWSMCTAQIPFGDRRMLGIHSLGSLQPGQVEEFTTAWTVHPNPNLPCGLGSTFDDITEVRMLYDNGFAGVGLPLAVRPEPNADAVTLVPNPTSGALRVRYAGLQPLEFQCFDAAGRLVGQWANPSAGESLLDLSGLANGTYVLQIVTEWGCLSRRLVLAH